MATKISPILSLPVEILQQIARHTLQPAFQLSRSSNSGPVATFQLLSFRLTCRAFEKASFDTLVQRFPRELYCDVEDFRKVASFTALTSQVQLASKLDGVAITVGDSDLSNRKLHLIADQDLVAAKVLQYTRSLAGFYDDLSTENATVLSSALQNLRALLNPPKIALSMWEPFFGEVGDVLQMMPPKLFPFMDAIPSQMLQRLELIGIYCEPSSLIDLLARSNDTIKEFSIGDCKLVHAKPHWPRVLQQLALCPLLESLWLVDLAESSFSGTGVVHDTDGDCVFAQLFRNADKVHARLQLLVAAEMGDRRYRK